MKWKFKIGDIIRNDPEKNYGNDWLLIVGYSLDQSDGDRYETLVLFSDMYSVDCDASILKDSAEESYILMA